MTPAAESISFEIEPAPNPAVWRYFYALRLAVKPDKVLFLTWIYTRDLIMGTTRIGM